jgi:integrase
LSTRARHPLIFLYLRIDAITGARRSEILGLTRDDFDPDLGTLTIRRAALPGAIVERTKSERGARVVAVDSETATFIQKSLAEHDSEWLFPVARTGSPCILHRSRTPCNGSARTSACDYTPTRSATTRQRAHSLPACRSTSSRRASPTLSHALGSDDKAAAAALAATVA